MQSVADVAAEHAALLGTLQPRGIAVVNADDDYAPFWNEVIARRNAEGASLTVRDFGLRAPATVVGRVRPQSWGNVIEVATPEGTTRIELKMLGRHNVSNALGAIAAATAAGAKLDAVAQGLATFRPIAGRLETKAGRNGATLIDDSYNANPDSVRAAIAALVHATGPKWLVLGDMGEVGQQGAAFHREIGECARAAGRPAADLGRAHAACGRCLRTGRRAFCPQRGPGRCDRKRPRSAGHGAGQGLALHAHGARRRRTRRRHRGGALMLLALANWIAADVRAFNVFSYITLRSVLATMTALMISFVIGPRMIRKLTEYKIGSRYATTVRRRI